MKEDQVTMGFSAGVSTGGEQASEGAWSEVHQRLKKVQAIIEQKFAADPEEKKKILRARAKMLAREPEAEKDKDTYIEVVEFLLTHEKYAVDLAYVREVFPLKEITPLPCTPPYVLGIINVRGEILSVINLKHFFNLPEKKIDGLHKVIILYTAEMEFGIIADTIFGVRSVPLDEILQTLPTLTGIRAEYLKGVTGERTMVLDALRILSDKRIIVNEEVSA